MVGQYGTSGNIGTFNKPINAQPRPGGGSGNMIGGLINTGIGLLENNYNQGLADDRVTNLKNDWRDQVAVARPGNINGGLVNVNYDTGANSLNVSNSSELQGLLANQYAQQGGLANQLSNLDPFALGNFLYDQGSGIRNQEQAQQRAEVLERLNATGMLSSSSGNQLQGQIAQQQNLANAQERNVAMMQGQEVANAIANRQNAAISNIYGAEDRTQNAIQNAINMGVSVSPPDSLSSAYQNQADAKQGFAGEVGSSLSDMLGLAGGAVGGPIGGMLGSVIGKLF